VTTSRSDYTGLAHEAERQPKRVVDHRDAWERLTPLLGVNGAVRERVQAFAERKRITLDALIALGTRVRVDRNGGVELAWGYPANGAVTAVKFRPLGDKPRYALAPSVFLEPLITGRVRSLEWFLAEGESDAARLFDVVGDRAAILVLPAGALTFKPAWAAPIPRGATVHLCHDADRAGDEGAAKAASVLGGHTVRVRPPDGGDWCDWDGDRDAFLELVRQARAHTTVALDVVSARELCERPDPEHDGALLGPLVVQGARTIVLGHTGAGKSTLITRLIGAAVHGSEFLDWSGITGTRALIVDLEQSEADAKRMLREASLDKSDAVGITLIPDGLELDTDDEQLAAVEQAIVDGTYNVVAFDPYYKAHRAEDANAERQIDDLMRRLDGLRARHGFALILGAHPRKPPVGLQPALTIHDVAGSGAAVRGAEIIVAIERVSDGYSRLRFLKDRAGRLPVDDAWGLLFDRETGYRRDPNDGKTRDIRAELLEALADTEWRTVGELRRKQQDGCIGADPKTIRPVLDALTEEGLLEYGFAPPGKARNAKCWRVVSSSPNDSHDTTLFLGASDEPAGSGVVLSSPYRGDSKTTPPHDIAPAEARGVVKGDEHPSMSARPSAAVRLANPDAFLTRGDLRELGLERRAVDAVFRTVNAIVLPGYSRPLVKVSDYLELLERSRCAGRVR